MAVHRGESAHTEQQEAAEHRQQADGQGERVCGRGVAWTRKLDKPRRSKLTHDA
jgi:hypothetical protein